MIQASLDFTTRLDQNNRQSEHIVLDNYDKLNNQCKTVYDLLKAGNRLTVLGVAVSHGIGDLRARIHTLRREGIDVKDEIKPGGFKEYYL